MKTLYGAVFLALLAVWLHRGQGDQTCDKKSGPCYCEGSNISKIDLEGVLKDSIGKAIEDPVNPGKYDYHVNFCSGFTCSDDNSTGEGKDAVACQRQLDGKQNVSSKLGDVKEHSWLFFGNNTFAVVYARGDPAGNNKDEPRSTMLYIFVVEKNDGTVHPPLNYITFIEERVKQPDGAGNNNAHVYVFKIYITPDEENRGGGGGNKAGVIGIVIILLVILAILAYFIIGSILMYTMKGARGIEIIPQYTFWKAVPGYIKDGFMFAISPCMKLAGREKTGYQSL